MSNNYCVVSPLFTFSPSYILAHRFTFSQSHILTFSLFCPFLRSRLLSLIALSLSSPAHALLAFLALLSFLAPLAFPTPLAPLAPFALLVLLSLLALLALVTLLAFSFSYSNFSAHIHARFPCFSVPRAAG